MSRIKWLFGTRFFPDGTSRPMTKAEVLGFSVVKKDDAARLKKAADLAKPRKDD